MIQKSLITGREIFDHVRSLENTKRHHKFIIFHTMLQTGLSADSIRIMMDNREEEHNGEFLTCNPCLQILSISEIDMREGLRHRYCVVLSDSQYMANGVLSADLDHLVDDGVLKKTVDGVLKKNCVVKVKLFASYCVSEIVATMIVIMDLDVVGETEDRIGCPAPIYWFQLNDW